MSDEILGQVALGYSAFIDRNRAVTATRLTVFPLKPDQKASRSPIRRYSAPRMSCLKRP